MLIKRKSKPEILLNILLSGYCIVKDDIKYCLSEDGYLCQVAIADLSNEEYLLKVNFGEFELKQFIDWAEAFTDEEVSYNLANKTINELKYNSY